MTKQVQTTPILLSIAASRLQKLSHSTLHIPLIPQPRGILAPPGASKDVADYWTGVLTRLIKTPGWRKYLESNYLEEGFLTGAELNGFVDDLTAQMRDILKEAGAKVVR